MSCTCTFVSGNKIKIQTSPFLIIERERERERERESQLLFCVLVVSAVFQGCNGGRVN